MTETVFAWFTDGHRRVWSVRRVTAPHAGWSFSYADPAAETLEYLGIFLDPDDALLAARQEAARLDGIALEDTLRRGRYEKPAR